MADDDWLQEFNKPKPKPVEVPQSQKPILSPPPVKEVFLREPPPSLIHTNSSTHYVVVNSEINMVLKFPEWVIERLNFLFLSKSYVVVIACDPSVRKTDVPQVLGYGIMRAMGRREIEVNWLRIWNLSADEISAKNLMTPELHRNTRGQTLFEETSNLQGRNLCRYVDKLVFNSVETEYLNERELVFNGRRARLNKRFQADAEVKLVNASYAEYAKCFEQVAQDRIEEKSVNSTSGLGLPCLRVLGFH